ncbi:patatin-like phospholipase family protein [Sedimenticola hydrogenitrophicus]|uniref:patatin-like phospholipase family protein n=1 Tax=Sedimenticola hydrogenitrophicus TaxID=2967975 RepID=UPI0023AE7349|nr:patatin-like phospholipase family protein [Sedimenticola hydrogenitrophicus]
MADRNHVINFALQGGGAHGAFTWGVLDRLLEEEWLGFEGVSGTSAGAMNAALLACGYAQGGRPGARHKLGEFWTELGTQASMSFVSSDHELSRQAGHSIEYSPLYQALMTLGWFLSPYQFNPLALNPLRELVERVIDFSAFSEPETIRLYIATTQVRTGKIRVFENHELSPDVLLASACLPTVHHSIEIDGEPYWDGAYSGNPAIFPLLSQSNSDDIIIVLLSPLQHASDPDTAAQIRTRAQELGFSAAFLREMRAIADIKERYGRSRYVLGRLERKVRDLKIHLIEANDLMNSLNHTSRLNTHASFLEMLRDQGRDYAQAWLAGNRHHLGRRTSVDLLELFT